MDLTIRDVEIRNYKSIGNVLLDNVKRLNIIIGKNNSGKSTVIDALRLFYNGHGRNDWTEDYVVGGCPTFLWHNYDTTVPIELNVTFQANAHWASELLKQNAKDEKLIEKLSSASISVNKLVYFDKPGNNTHFLIHSMRWGTLELVKPLDLKNIQQAPLRFIAKDSRLDNPLYVNVSSPTADIIKTILTTTKYALVPAKRRISEQEQRIGSGAFNLPLDGSNLKNVLQRLKNSNRPEERNSFRRIKERMDKLNFSSGVMESVGIDQNVDLTFDRDKQTSFPLSAQGTGTQEILIYLVNAILCQNHVFAIEEPENHLHYDGQRALLEVLEEESERNQIFITSHSSLFVDRVSYELAAVYLTRIGKDGQTELHNIGGPEDFELIVEQIGNISSLVLPDAVIFVEGESDEAIFREISATLKVFSRARLEFIGMSGREKLPYFAQIKFLLRASKDIPFYYLADGTAGKDRQHVINEVCKSAKDNVGLDDDQISRLRSSIFVLSRPQIEAYLLKPEVIEQVFQIPTGQAKSWFETNSTKKNKFYVLDSLLRKYSKGKYDKNIDGAKIAKALTKEQIDSELVTVIEQIVELSRRLERGSSGAGARI